MLYKKKMTNRELLEAALIHEGSKNIHSPYHALVRAPARAPYSRPDTRGAYNSCIGSRFTMHPIEFWALMILTPFSILFGQIFASMAAWRLNKWNAKSPFTALIYEKQWLGNSGYAPWSPMPDCLWLFFGTLTSSLCNVFLISLPLYLAGVAFVDTLWVAGVLNGAATVWIVFREVVGLREMLDDIEADRDDI